MKALFAVAGLALALGSVSALVSTSAMADEGQRFDWAAQTARYTNDRTSPQVAKQCFNGSMIAGANRAGGNTLFVQSAEGGAIYQMRLAGDCSGLNAARKIALRSDGSDVICPGDRAELTASTSAGSQLCRVADVRRVTASEGAKLSKASIR